MARVFVTGRRKEELEQRLRQIGSQRGSYHAGDHTPTPLPAPRTPADPSLRELIGALVRENGGAPRETDPATPAADSPDPGPLRARLREVARRAGGPWIALALGMALAVAVVVWLLT